MNSNFGILDPLDEKIKNKKERYEKLSERSLEALKRNIEEYGLLENTEE